MQKPRTFKRKLTQTLNAGYLLFLPRGYDAKKSRRWPLLLFLHGAGERGTNLNDVKRHGPPKMVKNNPNFPFILVSPQCPDGQIWSEDILIGLLDEVMKQSKADARRVYLTGLSMGGYATWRLGLKYPERFAAIAPICGGGEPLLAQLTSRQKAGALKSLAIWAFHGAKDPIVKLYESERMVAACRKAGVKEIHLTIYPEAEHDSWTEAYQGEQLYQWFLKHQRKTQAPRN